MAADFSVSVSVLFGCCLLFVVVIHLFFVDAAATLGVVSIVVVVVVDVDASLGEHHQRHYLVSGI